MILQHEKRSLYNRLKTLILFQEMAGGFVRTKIERISNRRWNIGHGIKNVEGSTNCSPISVHYSLFPIGCSKCLTGFAQG
jgi:hypothetical protein